MFFNSYIFILLFLPLVLIGYYGINRAGKYKLGMLWLIGMSCWFYGAFSIKYLLFFGVSIAVNQLIPKGMEKTVSGFSKKVWLAAALFFNIGFLVYYKYSDFFIENVNRIFRTEIPFLELAMPVGISFYTFRQLSYVIDCYQERVKPYSFMDYASYALFFPLLIQGPIARHDEVIPQFQDENKKKADYVNLSKGIYAFARGIAKKVLLADTLSPVVAMVFPRPYAYDAGNILIAMLCYTFQIYFDFSGYCDMAYGIGQMLNIELPLNFHSPYKAESISDFWDRWHITLTKFFTKYVYIPLGGSRKGSLRTCVNVMLVFLLSGFWHGANWTFVLWGVLNGVLMVLERIFKKGIEKVPKLLRRGITFILTVFLWSIFRAPTLAHEKVLLTQLGLWKFGAVAAEFTEYFNELTEIRFLGRLGLQGVIDAYPAIPFLVFLFFLLAAVWVFKNTGEKTEELAFNDTKGYGFKMAEAVLLLTWSILSLSEISEFIYFNF